jgi:hypothetical protein
MRFLKTQATIIRAGLEAGCDPIDMPTNDGDFPKDQNKIDMKSTRQDPVLPSQTFLVSANYFSIRQFDKTDFI